ncbi:hypothetical protein AMK59_322 [Oryctes borbonicus]|uniref:Transferrin-like domain-containing protein n=1 Tax=Oryctes borbonicus TaxID=1629725 RepID=A0A0T6BB44_9SCAR|nr:hypothetical protein AMK59_322 [Oryctes borbonicus]
MLNQRSIIKRKYSRLSELCSTPAYLSNTGKAFTQSLNCVVNSNNPAIAITTISAIENLMQTQNFSAYTICRNRTTSNTNEILCEWSTVPNKIVIANRNTYANLRAEFQGWFAEYLAPTPLAGRIELTPSQIEQMRTVLFPQPYENYKIVVSSELRSLYETTSEFRQNLTIQQSRQCRTEMRWCTSSDNEQRKCEAWSTASLHNAIQPVLQCVQAANKRECIDVLKMNNADVVTIGADFGYFAKLAGLEAIAFPETEREFLIRTVLVVQPNITRPENLRGKKGCFSRYGNAAWLSFVNVTRSVILDKNTCEYGQLLSDALGSSCMPGAGSLKLENLCSLCVSNTSQVDVITETTCATGATNRYYGNQGALDCLRDVGDFAVITKTEGLKLPENVRVMCRNSTLADSSFGLDVDDNCFLSVITTDEIVSRRGDAKNVDIQLMLRESDRRFAANSRTPFKLFGTFDSIPNMLFRDSTPGLDLPNSQNQWIQNYQSLFRHIDSCKAGSSVVKTPSLAVLTLISLMFFSLNNK